MAKNKITQKNMVSEYRSGKATKELRFRADLKDMYIKHGMAKLKEESRFGKSVLYEAVAFLGWKEERILHLRATAEEARSKRIRERVNKHWLIERGWVRLEGHTCEFAPSSVKKAKLVNTGKFIGRGYPGVEFFMATLPAGFAREDLIPRTYGVAYGKVCLRWEEVKGIKRIVLARKRD